MLAYLAVAALMALALGAAYVRLAPSDPALWHVAPVAEGTMGEVARKMGSASLRLDLTTGDPGEVLQRLDTIALASPRTTRLAGSVEDERITWVTRTPLWGFPDYTTAEARADGVYIHARQRFGTDDWGVNAARLQDWLSRL